MKLAAIPVILVIAVLLVYIFWRLMAPQKKRPDLGSCKHNKQKGYIFCDVTKRKTHSIKVHLLYKKGR